MRIENNYSPNFGAKYINNTAQIFNKHANKERFVTSIEIDPQNIGDIKALKKISEFWEYGKFATNIYYAACAMRNDSIHYTHNKIFALTKQSSDLENLDPDKILGLVHVSPFADKSLFIEHIEVNPEIIYSRDRKYKGIGTALINYLKTITDKISCFPSNTLAVKNFYFKNGFTEIIEKSNLFVWHK